LNRTFVGPTNSTVFTWSAWVKRGSLTGTFRLFGASTNTSFGFNSSDQLLLTLNGTAAVTTTAVYRDPSAWYHIVYVQNGAAQTIYINNNSVGTGATANTVFNTAIAHQLGAANTTNYFDGYLTEVNFIDGQALTPASFGAIDSSTGVWAPRPYSGTYGNNGFYLKFGNTSSVAALGTDSSGNGNTWTVNNVSLTAGATYDSMIDVPVNYADGGNGRGNYCTLNPLDNPNTTISASQNGNLTANLGSGGITFLTGTHSVFNGKYYWEYTASTVGNGLSFGITYGATTFADVNPKSISYSFSGTKRVLGVDSAYGASYTTNDVIGVAVDSIAGTIQFFKNNVAQPVITDSSISLQEFKPCVFNISSSAASLTQCNFGQRPFAYTPPAGFRALNTNNLPTPSIVNGANFMAATTYTGNAAARSLSNAVNSVSFQPDLVWIKSRTPGATSHALFDSVRGTGKYLSSDTTAAETTNANSLTAFNGDGFSLGTDTTIVNANANSYIAWQWRESITAGLDVVSYAGTGVNRTVAHNLGIAPAMIIVKRSQTGATSNWQVRHTSIVAANSIQLNLPNQAAAAATVWNSTAPTSSVFSLGTSTDVNASGVSYVAYCFAEIAGFSKFGSYTGNGSTDGPFVFCGFRPRFVMVKRTNTTGNWALIDSSRSLFNAASDNLYANLGDFETSVARLDTLSNGFKIRTTGGDFNGVSGDTYIFAAFAEVPSKYALAR
jgi:hypothetical protein